MDGGLVTAVFVDLDRSTELLIVGDTAGVAALEDLISAVRERIEPYGGRQVESLGDGLTVLFPAPRQAVSFAVGVQSALIGRQPRLRIGINTGEVVGPVDGPVGETIDAAARIATRAAGGEVIVSDVVRQLVGSIPGIRFDDRGRSRLRGSPDQWHLFAASAGDGEAHAEPVFGRHTELAVLDWLLAGLAEGDGRALALEGEAGIGKTHLVDALHTRSAASGALVLRGGADEIERDRPGRILLALTERLEAPIGGLLGNLDASEGTRGFAVVEALVDAVEHAAADRPVVVVAEDLHWADELSLRGIAALARRLEPLPVALAVTLRPSPRPPLLDRVLSTIAEAGASGRCVRISPLDDTAVGSLVASVTGAAPGPTLTARLGGAAGNPLLVIELLRAFDHDGALRVQSGVVDTDEQPLPANLREAVVRRLSSMTQSTVEVLRLASLLGSEFVLSDVATVAGQSVVSVAARLHEAVDAGVLAGDGDVLSFRHDLIREAVYEDIAPAIRRDLHAAAGRALSAGGAPTLHVARQFALGARPGDVAAVEWLERAAHEALALDPGIAVDFFERALALAPDGWAGRARIETALLEPLAWSGRVDEARSRAQDLLDRSRDPDSEFAARRGLAAVLASAGDLAAAVPACEAAAAAPGASVGEAQVLRCVAAGMALLTGRPPVEVRAVGEASLADAKDTAHAELECWAHQTLCLAALAEGRHDDALDHARSARDIVEDRWVPAMGFLIPHLWVGSAHAYLDRFDDFFEAYATGRRRAERRGEPPFLILAHGGTAACQWIAGAWDDATSEIEAGLALAAETGGMSMTTLSHALAARIALSQGNLPAAEDHLAAGHQVLAAGGHLFGVDLLLWTQAGLFEAKGEPAAALALLTTLWDQTAAIRFLLQYRNFAPDLARLAVAHGALEQALAVAAEVEAGAQRSTSVSATAVALRVRGLVDGDAELLAEAVGLYRGTPRRIELAGACEDTANALIDLGRRGEAAEYLDESAAIYADAPADRDLARVDALLRACGRARRRAGPARAERGWDALSSKEREVVDLVVQGLSNPAIGTRLYISRRTVETHLSHIFRKLDVANRTQLATAAAARTAGEPA